MKIAAGKPQYAVYTDSSPSIGPPPEIIKMSGDGSGGCCPANAAAECAYVDERAAPVSELLFVLPHDRGYALPRAGRWYV
jgi:hypothetical protein